MIYRRHWLHANALFVFFSQNYWAWQFHKKKKFFLNNWGNYTNFLQMLLLFLFQKQFKLNLKIFLISRIYIVCVWYIGTCQSYIKLKILKSYFYICFKYTLYCILNLLNEGYVPQFQFEVMGLHPLLSQSMPQLTASLLSCKIYQSNHQIYWTNECKMDWWAFGIFKKRRE